MASARYVDTELERPRWRLTLSYRLLHRAQIGVEYNPVAGEVVPLATVFVVTETERRPAAFLGTSSDRIGSPEGTPAYSEWDEDINFPFGGEWAFWRGFSVRPMYDGEETHLMLNWFGDRFGVSLMAVWMDTFGISVVGGF